jgi:hypothetical protein
MGVDEDEDHRRAVRVEVAKKVAGGYIGHNVLNRGKRSFHMRGIMHCKKDSGNKLKREEQAC